MPPALSPFTRTLASSAVVEFRRIADDLQKRGISIVDLGIGEPSAHSPPLAVEAMIDAAREGHDKYVDPKGVARLREEIAKFEASAHGLSCTADEIVVTTGSVGALSLATRALFGPGDEVLLPEPCYGPYRNQLRLTGAEPVGVPMPIRDGKVRLDTDALAEAISDRTKGLIINTPWNPSGRVLDSLEVDAIAALCIDADLWLIADEVYSELTYEPHRHLSLAAQHPDLPERTITVNSVSKLFAMTGWRLGYCVASSEVSDVLAIINHLTTRCATSFVQHGAIAAYQNCREFIHEQRESYRQRRDLMASLLSDVPGLQCPLSEGTFYAFASYPDSFGVSRELAKQLLRAEGVIVTPGGAYGPSTDHHLRLSFAASESTIIEAGERMARFFTNIARS